MMVSTALAVLLMAGATQAQEPKAFTAILAGHAVLPAMTLTPAPADAPDSLKVSGKYTAPDLKRRDKLGSIEGLSGSGEAARPTGISLPFEGQPVQGMSGIRSLGGGEFLTLTDNGFGNKMNSADAMLMAHRLKVDFASGKVDVLRTLFLHDPDKIVPFRIINEATPKRYLTGADLDIESIQPIAGSYWFGDEFGPYLLRTDMDGKVTGFWETSLAGKPLRSPDHYALTLPGTPDGKTAFNIKRSKGYEGMAQSPDGAKLYALLEGPVWDATANAYEAHGGKTVLRILEFDVAAGQWTGRSVKYPLEQPGHAIGDFNMIDATRGMIIERDDGEGVPSQACQGAPRRDCFATPARFKRVYMIDVGTFETDSTVRKIGYIDLMAIADPDHKARLGGGDGKFDFPFFTIENVDKVDGQHIVVANDNNLPFSAGRAVNQADNNEFILLRVPEFLNAR